MIEDKRNVIDTFKGMEMDRIRACYKENALPFKVCLENLSGGLNQGVIGRTANAMGCAEVMYVGKRRYDKRSLCGSHHVLSLTQRSFEYVASLKNRYLFVGIENNILETIPYYTFNYPKNTLLIFGCEETGLTEEMKDLCDVFVTIPQNGSVRSLNCSVAASIIMADLARKYALGL